MRLIKIALLLGCSSLVHAAWPFKASDVQKAAEPLPESQPNTPFDLFTTSTDLVTATPSKREVRKQTLAPTPTDWFNGEKPLAWQPYAGGAEYSFRDYLIWRPKLFVNEALAVIVLIFFGFFAASTRKLNGRRVEKWLQANQSILEEHFASPLQKEHQDDSHYVAWFSGRKGLTGLCINFTLKPRSDLVTSVYQFGRSLIDLTYQGSQDTVEFVFEVSHWSDETILAVLDKSDMAMIRDRRWDLRAFTSLAATSLLPERYALFHETSASSEALVRNQLAPLLEWLKHSSDLTSFILSDVSDKEPSSEYLSSSEPLKKNGRITFQFKLPSDASRYSEATPWLVLAINTVDALTQAKLNLTAAEFSKIRKRRAEIVSELTKEYRKEIAEEAAEKLREQRKKEADAKYNSLSVEQQKRHDDLEKKRAQRKASGRTQTSRK